MFCITEAEMIRNRVRWNMDRLSPEDREYAETEARRLEAMHLTDEDGKEISYDSWLDEISGYLVACQDSNRAALAAEMTGL